jgi:hypothetical protein
MSWKRQQEFVGRYIKFARHAAWGENMGIPGVDGTATPPVTAADDTDPMGQPLNRRQRRMQEKDARKEKSEKKTKGIKAAKASPAATPPVGATGPRKRVVAENGKILVVDSVGNVYLEQADKEGETHEFLLDVCHINHLLFSMTNIFQPNELPKPTLRDTALYRIPIWTFNRLTGRIVKPSSSDEESDISEEDVPSSNSGAEDFEVLEKVKTTAQNGTGKAVRRKKSTRGR